MKKKSSGFSVSLMVARGILGALIVVLALLGNTVRFGPFPITLALVPIIIGAALYGANMGAQLGGFFGLMTLIIGLSGFDGGTVIYLMGISPVACVAVCVLKGVAAGWFSGLAYTAVARKNENLAVIVAGVVCPVVNTGVFISGMLLFFTSALETWANGQGLLYYVIFGLTGLNFLVETAVNLVLSSGITTIVKYAKGRNKK